MKHELGPKAVEAIQGMRLQHDLNSPQQQIVELTHTVRHEVALVRSTIHDGAVYGGFMVSAVLAVKAVLDVVTNYANKRF